MTTAPVAAPTAASTAPANSLASPNTFLQLLVTEMSHQDPLNPMDPSQMVAQLAQLSTVQELTQTNAATQLNTALLLVGQRVTGLDPATGQSVSGTVSGIRMTATGPLLTVNNSSIPFGSIQSVP